MNNITQDNHTGKEQVILIGLNCRGVPKFLNKVKQLTYRQIASTPVISEYTAAADCVYQVMRWIIIICKLSIQTILKPLVM